MRETIRKNRKYILFILVLLAFGFTRLYHLTILPFGLHTDETGMAYDAWCLSQYGVDRYLKSWPVYLTNYGDGQSALYAYLCAGLFKMFGFHRLLIRIPAVLFSLLTLIFGTLIAEKIYPKQVGLSFMTAVMVTFCPYFILAGRFGLDCNLMLGMSTVFLYFFITAVEKNTYRYYVLAGLTGGLTLYTYILSYLIMPAFLLLACVYLVITKRFSLKKWAVMAVPLGMLAFPLILVQLVNMLDLEEMKLGIFTITKLLTYRSGEISGFYLPSLGQALKNIFIGDHLVQNSCPGFYNLYAFTIPLAAVGFVSLLIQLVKSLRTKAYQEKLIPFIWFLTVLLCECHITPNVNKINAIFLVTVLMAVEGIRVIASLKWRSLSRYLPMVTIVSLTVAYGICFLRFGNYYFRGQYTADHYPMSYFDILVPEAIEFLEENPQYKQNGTFMAEHELYFALSSLDSPYDLRMDLATDHFYDYYDVATLGEIEEGYNYIVRDIFTEYANELRALGYEEIRYNNYSLFYRK